MPFFPFDCIQCLVLLDPCPVTVSEGLGCWGGVPVKAWVILEEQWGSDAGRLTLRAAACSLQWSRELGETGVLEVQDAGSLPDHSLLQKPEA